MFSTDEQSSHRRADFTSQVMYQFIGLTRARSFQKHMNTNGYFVLKCMNADFVDPDSVYNVLVRRLLRPGVSAGTFSPLHQHPPTGDALLFPLFLR